MPKITEKRIKALEAAIRDPLVPKVSVDAITDLIADYRALKCQSRPRGKPYVHPDDRPRPETD